MKKIKTKKLKIILCSIILIVIIITLFLIIIKNIDIKVLKATNISEIVGKTSNKKIIKIEDKNGQIFYLPKGFKISDNVQEQVIENGLVIIDDTGDEETQGSEFVWIPVDNTNYEEFKKTFTNLNGSSYKNLDVNLLKENAETEKYIKMRNSVYKYGGFYISRYEAGISNKMKAEMDKQGFIKESEIVEDTTSEFANGKYKPVSKPNTIVWNNIQWGGDFEDKAFDTFAGNEKLNGAVKVSNNMYTNSSKSSIKSNLCFGSQWDAVINFIDSNYYNNTCEDSSIVVNATEHGNYNKYLAVTGDDERYSQKNIFDLCGNVSEWTLEAFDNYYRIVRGGSYSLEGDNFTISSSKELYPSDYYKDIGFRVALYIE